jgi:glycerol-3-phosphate acyltransferase PlsY
LRSKGGKGASTALGGVLVIHLWLGLGTLLVALLFLPITRSFNRAGMIAMALVPVLAYLLRLDAVIIGGMVALALLLLFAHRENWSATRPSAPAATIENARIENQPH